MNRYEIGIAILLSLTVLGMIAFALVMEYVEKYVRPEIRKKEHEAYEHRCQQIALDGLRASVECTFYIDFDLIHEITTQDEIVRIVNLFACEVALLCVNEDKARRSGEDAKSPSSIKKNWSEARKLALQIVPQLADRMPHFSEFEPLKSYNAEHLLRKKAKQSATA